MVIQTFIISGLLTISLVIPPLFDILKQTHTMYLNPAMVITVASLFLSFNTSTLGKSGTLHVISILGVTLLIAFIAKSLIFQEMLSIKILLSVLPPLYFSLVGFILFPAFKDVGFNLEKSQIIRWLMVVLFCYLLACASIYLCLERLGVLKGAGFSNTLGLAATFFYFQRKSFLRLLVASAAFLLSGKILPILSVGIIFMHKFKRYLSSIVFVLLIIFIVGFIVAGAMFSGEQLFNLLNKISSGRLAQNNTALELFMQVPVSIFIGFSPEQFRQFSAVYDIFHVHSGLLSLTTFYGIVPTVVFLFFIAIVLYKYLKKFGLDFISFYVSMLSCTLLFSNAVWVSPLFFIFLSVLYCRLNELSVKKYDSPLFS